MRATILADSGSDVLNYAIAFSSRRTSLMSLPTARFIIGRMFTAWTAQAAGIKRGGRRDVAEASNRNRDGTHQRRERRVPCSRNLAPFIWQLR
jgi:hypothetical protein